MFKSVQCNEPSGEGGNDNIRTLHEFEAGHAGREAKRLPYESYRYNGAISMITVGDWSPVPFSSIGRM